MTRLSWSPRTDLETGVDHGVVYLVDDTVAWNGITSIEESPSNSSTESYYFDGVKTIDRVISEDFVAHINAYLSPEELDEYRYSFGFSYRTNHDDGHKIHLLYNVRMLPSSKGWTSSSQIADPSDFAWDLYTSPESADHLKPFSHLVIDVDSANPDSIAAIENLLYGTDDEDPIFPSVQEVIDLFEENSVLFIVDHGDGTWTAAGPDDMVYMLDDTTFAISSPTVDYIDEDTYTVRNY